MVSPKWTERLPDGKVFSLMIGELEMAISDSSTTRVTPKTALKSGSSQHGKARRASVASIWVVAMTLVVPSSASYVLA